MLWLGMRVSRVHPVALICFQKVRPTWRGLSARAPFTLHLTLVISAAFSSFSAQPDAKGCAAVVDCLIVVVIVIVWHVCSCCGLQFCEPTGSTTTALVLLWSTLIGTPTLESPFVLLFLTATAAVVFLLGFRCLFV